MAAATPFNHAKNIQYVLTVLSANDLPAVDNHGTTSDPYVIIKFGNHVAQTHYIKKSLSPTWDQTFRFQSTVPLSLMKFTVMDHNTIKHDVTLGEGEFNLDSMGSNIAWEGKIPLSGNKIKSNCFLGIKLERRNFTTMKKKMSMSLRGVEEKAKDLMIAKASNIAKLAYVTAYNHMSARKLEGTIEVHVQLGWFVVELETEVSAKEKEESGTIEVVEDSEHNIGPTQTKPTKGMRRNMEGRITDVLNNIETTSTTLSSNIAVTVKAGLVIGFLISPIPKIEIEVQIMFGVKVKAGVGVSNFVARPMLQQSTPSPPIDSEEEQELTEMIAKLANENESVVPQSPVE